MTPSPHLPQSLEELADLCHALSRTVERLEGNVAQLLAERTRDALPRPTWRDLEAIKKDVQRLEQIVCKRRRSPMPPTEKRAP